MKGSLENNLPKSLKECFVDVNGIVNQIDRKLLTGRIVNLYGLSGSGKTTYASEYCHYYLNNLSKNKLVNTRFFESFTEERLNIELRTYFFLKFRLNIIEMEDNDLLEKINEKISNESHINLFVFDNIPNRYYFLIKYLRELPRNVKILLTSTKPIKENFIANIEIKPFKKEQIEKYLNVSLKNKIEKISLKDFSNLMLSLKIKSDMVLPKKLKNTVNLLINNKEESKYFPIPDLIKEIQQQLNYDQPDLAILIKKSTKSELAFKIIQYISFLEHGFVSFDIISNLINCQKNDLKHELNKLIVLGLIEKSFKDGIPGVQITELVQNEVIGFMKINLEISMDFKKIYYDLLTCFTNIFKMDNPSSNWFEMSYLYFHVTKLLRMTKKFNENNNNLDSRCKEAMINLYKQIGIFNIYVITNYKNAIYYFINIEMLANELYPNQVNKIKADALQYIGFGYFKLGEFNNFIRAIAYYSDACAMKIEQFGTHVHSEIAALKHNIGICYDKMGNTVEAIEFKLDSLRIRKNLADIREIAKSYNSLAVSYERLGDLNKAIYYDKKTLKLKKKVYQKESETANPEIADSLYYLGISSIKLKDWNAALVYFQDLYETFNLMSQNSINFDVQKFADCINFISICYLYLGFQEKADHYREKYEKFAFLPLIKPNRIDRNYDLIQNEHLTNIRTNNLESNETKSSIETANPKNWTVEQCIYYFKKENNINSNLISIFCSNNKIDGNLLYDYYLILTHNLNFFKQLLKLQSNNELDSNDIENFIVALQKLF